MNAAARVAVVTDSACDLGPYAEQFGITVVPLTVTFGSEQYRDGVDLKPWEFFAKLRSSPHHPVTSQPPPAAFADAYRRLLGGDADHVVSLHLSAKLSGTYGAAKLGAAEFGAARVSVVDTRQVSAGLGLLAIVAAQSARRGAAPAEVLESVEAAASTLELYVAIPTLTYLARGGRIGQLRSLLGNVLRIVPIVTMADGEVRECAKVRTFARAVEELIAISVSRTGGRPPEICAVMHSMKPEEADPIAKRTRDALRPLMFLSCLAGATLGSHIGPGAIGIFFIK